MEQNNNGKKVRDQEQDRRILWLEDHWSRFNSEMGDVKETIVSVKSDIKWLKIEFTKMGKVMEDVSKKVNSRPSWITATVFSVLFSTLIGLVVYLITK